LLFRYKISDINEMLRHIGLPTQEDHKLTMDSMDIVKVEGKLPHALGRGHSGAVHDRQHVHPYAKQPKGVRRGFFVVCVVTDCFGAGVCKPSVRRLARRGGLRRIRSVTYEDFGDNVEFMYTIEQIVDQRTVNVCNDPLVCFDC
jgi:hypothetical protein